MAKDAIRGIVGKTITHVVSKASDSDPKHQLFLVFDDDSYYEVWSESRISMAGSLSSGGIEAVRAYLPDAYIELEC